MLAEYLRRFCGIIAEYAEFLRLSSGAFFLYLPLHRLSEQTPRVEVVKSLRSAVLWFILFYLRCLSPCSSSSQPVPFLDSWNSGEKTSLSVGRVTSMCTCWQFSRSYVSSLPWSSASKSPTAMPAEIPQKVAAQKGAFKLSNKLFFHTLRKYRKTFALQRYYIFFEYARKK